MNQELRAVDSRWPRKKRENKKNANVKVDADIEAMCAEIEAGILVEA